MNIYMSEQEQIQVLKEWIKKYGISIILGVAIALIGSYGWHFWQQSRAQRAEQASALYEQLLADQANHQTEQLSQIGNNLITEYPHSPYAALGSMLLANNAVQQGNLDLATQKLQWIINHSNDHGLQQIAKLRAARILFAQNKLQDALKVLNTVTDKNYFAAAAIIKGDIFVAQGDRMQARIAYQNALNALPTSATIRSLVQMKLDELAS